MTALTIFSDASYCPQTGAAGWGAWAKRDEWRMGRFVGGAFVKTKIQSPFLAELCGLANAVHHFQMEGALFGVSFLYLQCDNVQALGSLLELPNCQAMAPKGEGSVPVVPLAGKTRKAARKHPLIIQARRAIFKATNRGLIPIRVRHVKAHREGDGRNWVNEQCDAEARRHMVAQRAERMAAKHFEVAL